MAQSQTKNLESKHVSTFFFFLALLPHAIKDGKGFNQINNREVLINIVTKKKVTISQLHNSKCRIENTTQEQVK